MLILSMLTKGFYMEHDTDPETKYDLCSLRNIPNLSRLNDFIPHEHVNSSLKTLTLFHKNRKDRNSIVSVIPLIFQYLKQDKQIHFLLSCLYLRKRLTKKPYLFFTLT